MAITQALWLLALAGPVLSADLASYVLTDVSSPASLEVFPATDSQ